MPMDSEIPTDLSTGILTFYSRLKQISDFNNNTIIVISFLNVNTLRIYLYKSFN